jgi:Family of unknown function (DUF6677)
MSERKIDLKTPWVALVLAFLVPGAGHFYQGRRFKGTVYMACILGTFLFGMFLGEWRPVYWTENAGQGRFGRPAKKNLGFLAQAGVGTPAIFAYLQSRRYHSLGNQPAIQNAPEVKGNRDEPLATTIDAEFTGVLEYKDGRPQQPVSGRLHLEPWNRTFKGTLETANGNLQLGNSLFVDSRILGDPERLVQAGIVDGDATNEVGRITGSIPRGLASWLFAPLDDQVLQDLNRRLNKRFEMALVYTWIAGLLNILAIWDAVQGPAYGYGDEPPPPTESTDTVEPERVGRKEPAKAAAVVQAADANGDGSPPALAEAVVGETAPSTPDQTPRETR